MNRPFVIPGPETVIWWGVHVPLLSAAFGVAGIVLGHLSAPAVVPPLPLQRQAGLIAGGVLVAIAIAIWTGQRPLVVLAWSFGLGFSGMTSAQAAGQRAEGGVKRIGGILLDQLADRLRSGRPDANDGAEK